MQEADVQPVDALPSDIRPGQYIRQTELDETNLLVVF